MNPNVPAVSSDYEAKIIPGLLFQPEQILKWFAAENPLDQATIQKWQNDLRNPQSWISKEITRAAIYLSDLQELIHIMQLKEADVLALKSQEKNLFDEIAEDSKKAPLEPMQKAVIEQYTQEQNAEIQKNNVIRKKKTVEEAEAEVITAASEVKKAWQEIAETRQQQLSDTLQKEIEKTDNKERKEELIECKAFVDSKPKTRSEVEKVYAESLQKFASLSMEEYEREKWKKIEAIPYAPAAPAVSSMLRSTGELVAKNALAKHDPVIAVQLDLREALMAELLTKFKTDRTNKVLTFNQPQADKQQPTAPKTQTEIAMKKAEEKMAALKEKRSNLIHAKEEYAAAFEVAKTIRPVAETRPSVPTPATAEPVMPSKGFSAGS